MGGFEHTFKAEPKVALSVLVRLLGSVCSYATQCDLKNYGECVSVILFLEQLPEVSMILWGVTVVRFIASLALSS